MRFWKSWKARKFARYHALADTSYPFYLVPDASLEELRLLDGERATHIESRRARLKPLQSRMQQIKIAFIADVSLWMLDEYDQALQNLINRNLEYAREIGSHLSRFKAEAEAFEATFLAQTQEHFQENQFWWHHVPSSLMYARSHFGSDEATLYTIREVLDIPFRHLTKVLYCQHLELVDKYGFPHVDEEEFKPVFHQAPDAIMSLLDEYDALLEPGRKLVAQINDLEFLDRQEQSQSLWRNA
jgi:hypothetical protein